ncbi:Verruc_Plancto-restricted protein [Rubritalea squalenifaciens DSM 18772]|uniref:Verruc_Plancto-restricted protein n=2 Tax=Rubritalea TaxID=361050 RepID=A0A1M6ID49_9BACT|nr:Minf_1886 family protein [Rubritalea squalenifaciens]SHJ32389.1 Verruc_Plancto-restricted protein [Rubritalea squalenifaciens DSM 18772]
MQPVHFDQALRNIYNRDQRFRPEAFEFLKQALDYTVTDHEKNNAISGQHVTASQLLSGFRDLALKEFGPMAATLFEEWGITSCEDIGDMVFMLIDEGMFGKQDSDSRDDFQNIYDFQEVFVEPFLPKSAKIAR